MTASSLNLKVRGSDRRKRVDGQSGGWPVSEFGAKALAS